MEVLSATNAPSWRGTDIAPSLKTEWGWRFLAGLWRAVVGLAAPGIDLFYLPWVAMSSLLLLTALAREPWSAAGRGFCFGTTYNLVYLSWFLAFRPVFCEGNFVFSPGLMAAGFWILVSA